MPAPSNSELQQQIARITQMQQAGLLTDAYAAIKQLQQRHPALHGLIDIETGILLQLKSPKDALAAANRRLKVRHDAGGLLNKAVCLEALNQHAEALAIYTRLLQQNATPDLIVRTLKSKARNGQYNNADALLRDFQRYNLTLSIGNMAHILADSALQHLAIEAVDAGRVTVLSLPERKQLAHLQRMTLDQRAPQTYATLLAETPNDAELLTGYGAVLAGAGQFAEAIAACKKALQLNPGDAQQCELAIALLKSGAFVEGYAHYRATGEQLSFIPTRTAKPHIPPSLEDIDEQYVVVLDQGVGDRFRHLRFLVYAAQQGKRFTVLCLGRMRPLLEQLLPDLHFISTTGEIQSLTAHYQLNVCELAALCIQHSDWTTVRDTPLPALHTVQGAPQLVRSGKPLLGVAFSGVAQLADRFDWYPPPELLLTVLAQFREQIDLVVLNDALPDAIDVRSVFPDAQVAGEWGINTRDDFLAMHGLLSQIDTFLLPSASIVDQAAVFGKPVAAMIPLDYNRYFCFAPYLQGHYPHLRFIGKPRATPWQALADDITRAVESCLQAPNKNA